MAWSKTVTSSLQKHCVSEIYKLWIIPFINLIPRHRVWTLEIRVINLGVSQEFPHTSLLIAVFRVYLLAVNQSADCWLEYQAKILHCPSVWSSDRRSYHLNHPTKTSQIFTLNGQYRKSLIKSMSHTFSEIQKIIIIIKWCHQGYTFWTLHLFKVHVGWVLKVSR